MTHPTAISVMLHAWRTTPEGDIEYCDGSDGQPDGWCIYTRTDFDLMADPPPFEPFDISEEQDFDDKASAMAAGEARAAKLGVELEEY